MTTLSRRPERPPSEWDNLAFPKPRKVREAPAPINPINRERAMDAYEQDFGKHAEYIRSLPCIIKRLHPTLRTECQGFTVAAHFKSRGAGGDRFSLFPACEGHHLEAHEGIVTFQERYELDLAIEVEVLCIADPQLTEEEREAAELRLAKLREPR